ncbi:MAG: gliding motility lipoprotein GldH [Rikenellaceae bacterium]|nr:gliding motility lipoprotein GldH [Rikenellaceae bacterium]
MRFLVSIVPVLLFFASCKNENNIHFTGITNTGWSSGQPAYVYFNNTDTTAFCDIFILLRTTELFKYDKLTLIIETMDPGYLCLVDTVTIPITQVGSIPISGDTESLYMSKVKFLRNGEYRMKFTHTMPDEMIQGISGIGIRIIENGEK